MGYNEERTKATTPPTPKERSAKANTGSLKRRTWQSCGKINQGHHSEKIKKTKETTTHMIQTKNRVLWTNRP